MQRPCLAGHQFECGSTASLPANAGARGKALAAIRAIVSAAEEVTGERAKRLARIEAILGEPARAGIA